MKMIAFPAALLSIGAWVLTALTFTNLLSGYLSERTCQTDCVMTLFLSLIHISEPTRPKR